MLNDDYKQTKSRSVFKVSVRGIQVEVQSLSSLLATKVLL